MSKRKNNKKKPRTISLTLDMGKPVTSDSFSLTPDGRFQLLYKGKPLTPKSAYVESSYKRENKQKRSKILNKSYVHAEQLIVNPNRALQKYNILYAIDTNSECINDKNVSVSGIVICKIIPHDTYLIVKYGFIDYFIAYDMPDMPGKPENFAWKNIIETIEKNNNIGQIGIIVDSDLGNIPTYNTREKPIFENFYLPPNVELIYGSADVGREYLPNKLVKECDRKAKEMLNNIKANPAYLIELFPELNKT
jgi:hypothetical protein